MMQRGKTKRFKTFSTIAMLAAVAVALFLFSAPAMACSWCTCERTMVPQTSSHETTVHDSIRTLIDNEFDELERWWMDDVWLKYFPEVLVNMTHQLTVVAMYQLQIIGMMMDAKNQLETQRLYQELTARAHKDYRSSVQMCSLTTSVRSLAAAERRSEISIAAMNRWAQARHHGSTNVSATEGIGNDKANRLLLFQDRFCDAYDNNGVQSVMSGGKDSGMTPLCRGGFLAPSSVPVATRNKDIDYGRTIDSALTLYIDFADETSWGDEVDFFALASNLYDHDVSIRIPESTFDSANNVTSVLDVRSIAAKRGVAEESLFTIAGMKSPGSDSDLTCTIASGCSTGTLSYMAVLLKELGIQPDEIIAKYGIRPSYFAQMEVLTKKIYQSPDFYTDLYDSPANVSRKSATLQAIGLMQDFDTLESHLRTEMMISVMLELEIMKLQERVKKKILTAISSNG